MKRKLCVFLVIAMILTTVTIPMNVVADNLFTGDYVEGDTVKQIFDADNPSDIADLTTSDGSKVSTTTFGGETYAYTTGDGSLDIPQILPGVPSSQPIYVKLRLHALSNKESGNGVYIHTWSSQGKRAAHTITDAELGTSGMVSADPDSAGVDVIFKFNPNNEDGYGVYARPADSDGEWTIVSESKTYAYTTAYQKMMIYNNLAISSAVVYTKQLPELEAVNKAADAEEMSAALSTYATKLGVDLSKLDMVEDKDAVYELLLDTVFGSAAEVVVAFENAVETVLAQQEANDDTFEYDYATGDPIQQSFDAEKSSDVAALTTSDGSVVSTMTFVGETYAYTTGTSGHLYIPIAPAVPDDEPIYMKLRIHARKLEKFGAGTGLDVYTKNSQGKQIGGLYINDGDLGISGLVSDDAAAAGVDIILKFNPNTEDGYGFYVKKADSDEEWIVVKEGAAYKNNNALQVIRVGYNLAVSNVKTYTKQKPEVKAVNDAADVEEMKTVLSTYATELGIDLTKLDTVEDVNAVYESLLDIVFYSAEEIVAAFDAAVEAQQGAKEDSFEYDYAEGDMIKQSFDADNSSDVAGLTTSDGSEVSTTTFGGKTYAHTTGSGYLYVPIAPAVPNEEPIYMKLRVHALKLEKYGAGTGLDIYTTNSGGKQIGGLYINDGDLGVSGLVSADTDDAGLDIIFKFNPNTEDGYGFYVKKADSDGEWITINESAAYKNNSALKVMRVGYNLAVSDVVVYNKLDPAVVAVNFAAKTDAEAVKTAIEENYVALGIDLSQLEGLDALAVYAELVGRTYSTIEEIVADFNASVKVQRAMQNVVTEPEDIFAENDKVYYAETFDVENAQIIEYGTLTLSGDGKAYAADRTDIYVPRIGSMAGKTTRVVFKPDSTASTMNISLYDDAGNRYYRALSGLPNAWHEAVAYVNAAEKTLSVWYRNIDDNGSWKSFEVIGVNSTQQTRVGLLLITTEGVAYDEVVVYNGLYSDYAITENDDSIDLNGKVFYGTPDSEVARNAQFIFTVYNKKYGYTSFVDTDARVVIPAKEESFDKTYSYNPQTDNYAVMLWDSVDTGIVLGDVHGYKTPNKLGTTELSKLSEGEIVFEGYLNEVFVSGNTGVNNKSVPVTVSVVDKDGKLVSATQTTTNMKGAFEISLGIDAGSLESGTYIVKATCKDITADGTVVLCGKDFDYNSIKSSGDMVNEIKDYVDSDVVELFEHGKAYDKLLEIKGGKVFSDFYEFKEAVDEAVSYTVTLNQLLDALNKAVTQEKWLAIMNLVTVEYRDFLGLPTNPIKGISNEMALFKRMIKNDSNKLIVYETAEDVVDAFNDALKAQKLAEKSNSSSGGSGGSGGSSGSSGGFGFGSGIVKENASPQKNTGELIEEIENRRFKDLSDVPWAAESIESLYFEGIVSGDGNGNFYPNNSVKREEFLKMIILAAGIPLDETGELSFEDVDRSAWYFVYVNTAYKNGIINGMSDTKFGVGENISRADMAVMMNRVLDKRNAVVESVRPAIVFNDYKVIPDYARTSITTLYMSGLVEGMGDNTFAPGSTATKAESAVAINRIRLLLNN